MEWNLLEKTTFWIENIDLHSADLTKVASAAAVALKLSPKEVMVVDVRPGLVAFDILKHRIHAEIVAGKEKEILENISQLQGVVLGSDASVHSEGVLGLIALEPEEAFRALDKSEAMARNISKAVARRAVVFASGSEVIAGKIKDTNSPYIMEGLEKAGYQTRFGGILEDDVIAAANRLEGAAEEGYGLIITTGGVGAEDKDCSIEAIQRLDPNAQTAWILKFKPDYHRHHKEGVRIALGRMGLAYLIALPGPHEEAKLGFNRLLEGMEKGLEDKDLAEYIACALRDRWHKIMKEGDNKHGLSRHR